MWIRILFRPSFQMIFSRAVLSMVERMNAINIKCYFRSTDSLSEHTELKTFILQTQIYAICKIGYIFTKNSTIFICDFLLIFDITLRNEFNVTRIGYHSTQGVVMSGIDVCLSIKSVRFKSIE